MGGDLYFSVLFLMMGVFVFIVIWFFLKCVENGCILLIVYSVMIMDIYYCFNVLMGVLNFIGSIKEFFKS